jgi:hypothetical protein
MYVDLPDGSYTRDKILAQPTSKEYTTLMHIYNSSMKQITYNISSIDDLHSTGFKYHDIFLDVRHSS